jgi:hypothetical protein
MFFESEPIFVECKVIFTRMGTINTIHENFSCQAYIECCWDDDNLFNNLIRDMDINLSTNIENIEVCLTEAVQTLKYDSNEDWSPMIYIENSIGDLKEDIIYKLEVIKKIGQEDYINQGYTVRVVEMRYVEGVFYEVRLFFFYKINKNICKNSF